MELKELITEYKLLKQEMEQLEERLGDLRSNILKECNGEEYQGEGLSITKVIPEPSLDWRMAVKALHIQQDLLTPFFKERPAYFKLTLKRTIDV